VLDWTYRSNLVTYRPTRDPAGWLLLIVDLIGSRLGWPARDRVAMRVGDFFDALDELGLDMVRRQTLATCADRFARDLAVPGVLIEPVVRRMRVAALAWHLGCGDLAGREKHPQARKVRQLLRDRLDAAWVERIRSVDTSGYEPEVVALAMVPISIRMALATVRSVLRWAGDDIGDVPFAVFYALLTDARHGGRVWVPPDPFVNGDPYDRHAFELDVGHALDGTRSRRRRHEESTALSELGLSALFPRTIALVDLHLAEFPQRALWVCRYQGTVDDWLTYVAEREEQIERVHRSFALGLDLAH
jgi:hypothetical protein